MPGPRILAASTGFGRNSRGDWTISPLVRAAIDLSAHPRAPRLAYLGTAKGDQIQDAAMLYGAFAGTDVRAQVVALLPQPNVDNLRETLLSQDVIYVGGGSVAGLLALWRLHGLDEILREAWQNGVVLTGASAGSICWHTGGPTDSFGPDLRVITDGLGFLPFGNGVHYDSEPTRRPLLHAAVASGELPVSYATDNGVALLYEGTELADVLSELDDAAAYRIERVDGVAVETRLPPRVLR
ncbi:peptidase E [Frondihabitans australicus]|uniref:Peptidase E n=1 Tax=Frondihabitans australicus TaxID=386892 RepID=A0A495IKW0_9MICO|nr:peptidase E [Frondihabitans australicus]RKR75921.1 peptidase E [Frondihabitans australicus]